jgi:anti-sigma B factor antagonist
VTNNAETQLGWIAEPGEQVTVVRFSGEVDLDTHEEFTEGVRAGLDSSSPIVVLDLAGLAFMGSVGLRVLVEAHNETQDAGRALRLVDGSAVVHRIIEVTGLAGLLTVYNTLDEAKSHQAAPGG